MHEFHLIHDLMNKIQTIAHENRATKVTGVRVQLGALSHISAGHFREHFDEAAVGTPAEGANLIIDVSSDENDAQAQDILLLSVDVEETA